MDKFDDYRSRVPIECGPPPHWVIVDWLKEAAELRPNVMFRQRINEIHNYLDESISCMMDQIHEDIITGETNGHVEIRRDADQTVC